MHDPVELVAYLVYLVAMIAGWVGFLTLSLMRHRFEQTWYWPIILMIAEYFSRHATLKSTSWPVLDLFFCGACVLAGGFIAASFLWRRRKPTAIELALVSGGVLALSAFGGSWDQRVIDILVCGAALLAISCFAVAIRMPGTLLPVAKP